MSIKLLMVDDHRLVREGVCALLERQPGFKVVGQARNGHEALPMARQLRPHIVLMDLYIPGMTGIEATAAMRSAGRFPKIIALSACSDRRVIRRMIDAGASAFVAKCWPFVELCDAIRAVHACELYVGPSTIGLPRVLAEPRLPNAGKLSARETQTLRLIAGGKSSEDIAAELCISCKTVEFHRRNVRRKLGRSSVADLTRYAMEEGMMAKSE